MRTRRPRSEWTCGVAGRRRRAVFGQLHGLVRGAALAALAAGAAAGGAAEWAPERLQCNARTDPGAVDDPQPRLRWTAVHPRRGSALVAWQVLVASRPEWLDESRADLWNSGRVAETPALSAVYAGRALSAAQRCCWKVRAWDERGAVSAWSAPARWNMGLLQSDAWQGDWIGYDALRAGRRGPAPVDDASWIGHAADPVGNAPQGERLYHATFELPADVAIEAAQAFVLADDRWSLAVNGQVPARNVAGWKKTTPVRVVDMLQPGRNEVRLLVANAAPGPSGALLKLAIKVRGGPDRTWHTDGSWRSAVGGGADWAARPLGDAELAAVRVLGPYGMQPWGTAEAEDLVLPPAVLLRREFTVDRPVASAMLYGAALGVYDAHLNGRRVSEEYFNPGWTDYARRVLYRGYDVTDAIRPGANCLGAALADGWYSGYVGFGKIRDHYGRQPRVRMQLHLTYADGSREVVATDADWRAAAGPVAEADFLMGETYDARREMPGWDAAGFDASGWAPVALGAELQPLLQAHPGPPIVAIEEFRPVGVSQPRPGKYVFDLGQNFAGVPRLTVRGQPGQRIQLRFAERLNPDGSVYTENLREARVIDTYVCRGDGVETWSPRFTFHGFQYVEATGLVEPPDAETLVGVALSSDTPRAGGFACSHPLVNRLVNNIYWTQRSNFIDIPTDCPQRDERLGWTGDAQVYVATACLNADVEAFFAKWLVDLTDAQRADGQFPMVAPLKVAGDDGGPAWADAGVICPWILYETYGDRALLERQYPSMRRFVEFCRQRSRDGVLPPKGFHCFGDWLSIQADTPTEVIYTAYFAQSARLLSEAASVLGLADDARQYRELHERIKAAFIDEYVDDQGRIRGDTQCAYVLALSQDLATDALRDKFAARLVDDIESRGGHLSTGFIGTKDLMLALAQIDRNDVAYRLLLNETFPSWGFSIRHGATSIWERWDGWTPEKGFQDPGMNSFAHYSFGAVYQWMFENVAGVKKTAPGYARFAVAPQLGGGLSWARGSYDSVRGRIESAWRIDDEGMTLEVVVPSGAVCEVQWPVEGVEVFESGTPLRADPAGAWPPGIRRVWRAKEAWRCEVGSGTYAFRSPRSP